MTDPILALQAPLVAALRADAELQALLGEAIFDAPPIGQAPPYVVIARHDVVPRDSDLAPGHEHRLLLHVIAREPSRQAALAVVERVLAVALGAALDGSLLAVTHRRHERTETVIDPVGGRARAAVAIRMYSEPAT
ncbi:MAG TPA: DUF3168 domain-containing protein [Devosiaceae bacterium]|jgi:hypothetical protein|nr:DUF3168 domain-containing protein [Devosiaceae bacterium]